MKRSTLKETKNFRLYRVAGQFWIKCKDKNSTPSGRRISESDSRYLLEEVGNSFDSACVMDFGVGVFQKKNE